MKGESKWADGLILIAGAWFFSVPLWGFGAMSTAAVSNHYICGIALVLVSFISMSRPRLWEEWVNLVLGMWIFVAPFVLNIWEAQWALWNHLIVGAIVSALSLYALVNRQKMHSAAI